MMTKRGTPYQRGRDAALRLGEYENAITTPACPYPDPSPERELWYDGFCDATDEAIHWSAMA